MHSVNPSAPQAGSDPRPLDEIRKDGMNHHIITQWQAGTMQSLYKELSNEMYQVRCAIAHSLWSGLSHSVMQ